MTSNTGLGLATPDRLAALRELRASMDALIESVAGGTLAVADAFGLASSADPRGQAAANLYVVAVVEAAPGIGKVAARRLLADLGIAETTKLGELAHADRAAILDAAGRS
jgi:hypothetical protein